MHAMAKAFAGMGNHVEQMDDIMVAGEPRPQRLDATHLLAAVVGPRGK
jgi:hypothetical protein